MRLHEAFHTGDRLQGFQTMPRCLGECFEPAPHQQAVFINERHQIRHGAERHEIERLFQIVAFDHACFQQRVRDFEHQPDGAEVVVIFAKLRIHQRQAVGTPLG